MERLPRTEDVTAQVNSFLNHDPGPHGEQAASLPGLTVSTADGSPLTVGRHVQTFDGCHPYEYDESTDSPRFIIQSLLVSRRVSGTRLAREISTADGLLAAGDAMLSRYRFHAPVDRLRPLSDTEAAFRQILDHLPYMIDRPVDEMIGYRSRLLASAADPFVQPVSIPARSEYGSAHPLDDIPVKRLSLYTTSEGDKQVSLTVQESYSPEQTLEFVPLEAVRLTLERRTNQPAALLREALAFDQRVGNPDKLAAILKEYDQVDKLGYQVLPHVYRREDHIYSFTSRTFIGTFVQDGITDVRPLKRSEYALSFQADRLIREPVSGQLYLVDRESGITLSAQDTRILDNRRAQEELRNRELWLR